MSKKNIVYSAGILLYRTVEDITEVFLAHPGGPYWEGIDEHSWGIPKGRIEKDEEALAAAYREFEEEIGVPAPDGKMKMLGEFNHARRVEKRIFAYYCCAPLFEVGKVNSNLFELEWPPKSQNMEFFPEIDKVQWYNIKDAYQKIMPGQIQILKKLELKLAKKANKK